MSASPGRILERQVFRNFLEVQWLQFQSLVRELNSYKLHGKAKKKKKEEEEEERNVDS